MGTGGNNDRFMSDINVTPFVDVMLVLLIIFMVTAPMMTQGVDVTLPEATSSSLPAKEDQLVVTIDKENIIFINDYSVPMDMLKDKLIKIMENREDKNIFLRADREIVYGTVIRVMSEIKEAGISNIGMVTVPLDEPVNDKKENPAFKIEPTPKS